MILAINTADPTTTILFLLDENFFLAGKKEIETKNNLSEKLLLEIDKFLKSEKSSKEKLTGVLVNRGPGSYTGIRIGVSTANLLAFSLNLPIYGYEEDGDKIENFEKYKGNILSQDKEFGQPIVPFYKMPPHITRNKHC